MRHPQRNERLVVMSAFRFQGRGYQPGDEFYPRRLACSERELGRLIREGLVGPREERGNARPVQAQE